MSSEPRYKRLTALDQLRGLAATTVALSHGAEAVWPAYYHWQSDWISPGRVGVIVFFMISGWLFASPAIQKSRTEFAVRRLTRIYPTYWAVLALFLVAWWVVDNRAWSAAEIILNVGLVQSALGTQSIVPPAWTLAAELAFYALILLFIPVSHRRFLYLFWFAAAVALMTSAVSIHSRVGLPTSIPILLLCCFLSGTLRFNKSTRTRLAVLAMTMVCIVVAGIAQVRSQSQGEFQWTVHSYFLSSAIGVAIFVLAIKTVNPRPWLEQLGEVSYSLYLVHPLAYLVLRDSGVSGPMLYMLYCAFSLLLAKALYVAVEKPSIRLGREMVRKTVVRAR